MKMTVYLMYVFIFFGFGNYVMYHIRSRKLNYF